MKILFLTDNFPPEVNAPATRTYEHCKEWVKEGAEITVITCAPNFPVGKVYPGYKNRFSKENIDGINVIRVWSYITENKGTVKRTLDYMSFGFSAVLAGLFRKFDLIIGTSPQLFTALAAGRLSRLKRKPWIMEVRDIWPESIKTVGAVKDGAIIKYFERKEKRCYNSADKIVCVTNGIYDRLIARSVSKEKLRVFTNGANLEAFSPREKDEPLLNELGLKGKKIIGYLGTMGMSHKLDFILKSAQKITDPDVHILLIGEGAEKDNLLKLNDKLALKNVSILNGIPKDKVPAYLSIIDIALVNLRKSDLFLGALPSKIFENAAMGKPILLGLQGEAEDVINKYGAGVSFEPENESDFLDKIELLTKNKDFYMRCVEGSRKLAQDYNRKKIAHDMLEQILLIEGK